MSTTNKGREDDAAPDQMVRLLRARLASRLVDARAKELFGEWITELGNTQTRPAAAGISKDAVSP